MKTILITGASTGIGKATAKHFIDKGWNVIATMRTPENEKELKNGSNVLLSRLDVLDIDTINSTVEAGIEKFGKIDVLVNNAGYGAYGPLETFPRENIIRQFNTNVIGLIDVTRAVLPHFRENRSGVIVNISSIGGRMTFPLGSLYHGTKFAVEGISEALQYELDHIGVKVKIVEPGAIATDFAGRSFDFQNNEAVTEYQPIVQGLMKGFETILSDDTKISSPDLVASVIHEAVTDGRNQLRYTAGEDAIQFMDMRKKMDDESFINAVKSQFGV
jgi:short-subunit dehydrogenase